LYVQSDGKLNANLWQGSPLNAPLNVLSSIRVDDDNWHKVEFSAAPGSITVYIDGVLAGSSNGTTDHLSMTFNQLGAVKTTGVWTGDPIDGWFGFNGCIDEFIIIDRSLTATQIQQVTQLPLPTITSFSPTTAKSGEIITITGTNLGSASSVRIGGVEARRFTVVSATEIRAIVGKDATLTTDVQLTTAAGTITATTFTFDCTNNSLNFDGLNDFVQAGAPLPLTSSGNFTIEAWVRPSLIDANYRGFFGKQGSLGRAPSIWVGPNGSLHTDAYNASNINDRYDLLVNNFFEVNTWVHVAYVRNGNTFIVYKNGVQVASRTAPASVFLPNENFDIGRVDNNFNGNLDEVRVWNTARTAQQIQTNIGQELVGNESGLAAYYNFNQGTAGGTNTGITTLNNLTATANMSGTLTNIDRSGTASNFVKGVWPVIISQPTATTTACSGVNVSLTVSAAGPQLSYQWYTNNSASNTGGTAITGATSATYTYTTTTLGSNYFYAVVTGACSQTVTSTVSTVDVNATNWTKIYETTNPSRDGSGEIVYTAGFGKTGGAASSYNGNFNRIRYRLENNVAGTLRWAEVSFDAWTNVTLADLQIPDLVNNLVVQRNVSNIEVSSNMPGVHTGNFSTGRLELWNQNYFTNNSGLTPAGDPTKYDWDDLVTVTTNGHGSFQIHNVSPQREQTIFAWNMHRNGGTPEIGIGNAPSGNPDWTFNTSNGSGNFKVQISVQESPVITPNGNVSTCVGIPVTLTASAGASYLWSNGATTQSISTANAGNYTVTVTQVNGCNATSSPKTVTLTAPPTAATITGTQEVCVGGTTQFNAGQNVSGTWTTSNASIATVNSSGVITGVAAGNATITFTIAGSGGCANVVSTRTVTVTAAPIAGTLSGNNAICISSSTTFVSTQTGGTWSTSAANIALVNPASGLVTGVAAGTSIITYTVAGGGGCAAVTATRTITVNSLPIINYPNSAYSFERTKAITAIQPTSTGVTIVTYAISPSLPSGLSFSTTDGSISGTPSVVSTSATYTVSGTTAAGCSVTRTFTLQVFNAVVPSALSYAPASQTVRQGTAKTTMSPTASGDAVALYSISTALPQGLIFNTSTGVISGTLTTQQTGNVVYTITATNSGGSTTATVTLIYNTAPTDVALGSTSVAENAASGITVGTLSATDADAGDTFTYTLVSGTGATDNASFTISGSTLRTAAVFDFETKSSYSVRVRVTDAGGLTFEKAFTISVTNVNEAPTDVALSSTSVAENAASGTNVATLSATDIDAGDTFTYTLVSGTGDTDNASFTIDGATLKTAGVFDFETKSSYSVRVRVTDAGGLTFEKEFVITVANINDAPTNISLSAITVVENSASGTTVATLSATDADAGDTFRYTLVSGTGDTDNASFTIDGTTLKTAGVFDFETKSSYSIRVRVTDAAGLTFEKEFAITVTDINEAPTALALSNISVLENAASGTAVGTLAGTDPDAGDTHTYTLVTGTGSTDNASFTITGTTLNTAAVFNFEAKNSYAVRVRVTDAGGLSFERAFTITVIDVNEAPTLNAITDRRVYNVSTSQVVNLAGITAGPETAQTTTTSVSTSNPSVFSAINVVGTQIQFTLAAGIVTPQDVVVTVRVRDNGGVANGGVDTIVRTFRLGIDPMPVAAATPNLITLGATAQLSAAGANAINYTWVAVGGTGIIGSVATINVRPAGTTTYAVVVTNSFGYQATVPLLLTVIVDYKLVPNNLVTPNGDGVNDRWVIPNIDMYPDNEVIVYDKAGRAVFTKRGYNNEWDGTVNGKKLKEDAYFYVIKFNKDGALPIRGYVSIVR
jgi:gliding motility-associated-like protein